MNSFDTSVPAGARVDRGHRRNDFNLFLFASAAFLVLLAVFLMLVGLRGWLVFFLLTPLALAWGLAVLLLSGGRPARSLSVAAASGAAGQDSRVARRCSSAEKQLLPALLLTPVWTLALIKPLVFQWCAAVANSKAKQAPRALARTRTATRVWQFLLGFCAAYALSMFLNLPKAATLGRVVGGLYNLSIWLMGLLLIVALGKAGTAAGFNRWLRGLSYFGLLASSFACIGLIAWLFGVLTLQINSPFLSLLPHGLKQEALVSSSYISFIYTGWFFTAMPRSASIANYGTSFGFVMAATILATLHLARKQKWSMLRLSLFLGPQIVGLLVSQARVAMAALFLAAVHTTFYADRRKALYLLVSGTFLFGAVWFSAPHLAPHVWEELYYKARQGSETDRLAIYAADIAVWSHNPVLGIGYKPHRWGNLGYPLGSHSTYLGLLLKTGLLGFGLFAAFLLTLYSRWHSVAKSVASGITHSDWLFLGATLVVFFTAMLSEDLDATQVLPFIFFVTVGYTLGLARLSKQVPIRS